MPVSGKVALVAEKKLIGWWVQHFPRGKYHLHSANITGCPSRRSMCWRTGPTTVLSHEAHTTFRWREGVPAVSGVEYKKQCKRCLAHLVAWWKEQQ